MRNSKIRDMVLCALFAALMVLGAYVSIPLPGGAPITFQIFFAMMAGGILGSKLGAISITVYTLMGLVGVPVFAGGASGVGIIAKPTFGYLIGFIVCAYVVGLIVENTKNKKGIEKQIGLIVAPFIGLALDYLIGVPYLYMILKASMGDTMTPSLALAYGFWPFIILDLIKAFVVVGIIATIVPRLEREQLIA